MWPHFFSGVMVLFCGLLFIRFRTQRIAVQTLLAFEIRYTVYWLWLMFGSRGNSVKSFLPIADVVGGFFELFSVFEYYYYQQMAISLLLTCACKNRTKELTLQSIQIHIEDFVCEDWEEWVVFVFV